LAQIAHWRHLRHAECPRCAAASLDKQLFSLGGTISALLYRMRFISFGYALAALGLATGVVLSTQGCASSSGNLEKVDDATNAAADAGSTSDAQTDASKEGPVAANYAASGPPRTVFVNALKQSPNAVRVCFTRYPNARPFPHDQFAPLSNRLGIAKGTATATETIKMAAMAAQLKGFDDLGASFENSQQIALLEAAVVDFSNFATASCAQIIAELILTQVEAQPRFVTLSGIDFESKNGLQIVALTGDWTDPKGVKAISIKTDIGYRVGNSLQTSLQFANIAKLPETVKTVELELNGIPAKAGTSAGELGSATLLLNNGDITKDPKIIWTNAPLSNLPEFKLSEAQRFLDPSISSETYFRPRSNVVMLFIGDATPGEKPVSEQPHFIAIPAIDPQLPLPAANGEATSTAAPSEAATVTTAPTPNP
jgi:hypothetical protein